MSKGCKYCGSLTHYSIACFQKPRKAIKKIGKRGELWIATRKEWIEENPPDKDGFWYCHYCDVKLTIDKNKLRIGVMFLTLDHKDGRLGSLLTDKSRLLPACYPDNRWKGSQDYARFVERSYPHLLDNVNID